MHCTLCPRKPKKRCNREGFDCTGGKLDPAAYWYSENRDLHDVRDQMRADSATRQLTIYFFPHNSTKGEPA